MPAIEINSHEAVLVITSEDELLPFSTAGLTISSGWKSRVTRAFHGALVIHRDNSVERIDRIEFLGYYGRSIRGRLLSFANGGIRSVSVHLSPQPTTTFEDVKRRILGILRKIGDRQAVAFGDERRPDAVIRLVEEASNANDLFAALLVPAPEQALDILTPGRGRRA